jgi:hypothetical protein
LFGNANVDISGSDKLFILAGSRLYISGFSAVNVVSGSDKLFNRYSSRNEMMF